MSEELAYMKKYGRFPPGSDILGLWFSSALIGKREYYYIDKDGNEIVNGGIKVPGSYSIGYRGDNVDNPLTECVQEIKLHWDQWVACYITCDHGRFKGVSDFLNFTESIVRAVIEFNEIEHPGPHGENG